MLTITLREVIPPLVPPSFLGITRLPQRKTSTNTTIYRQNTLSITLLITEKAQQFSRPREGGRDLKKLRGKGQTTTTPPASPSVSATTLTTGMSSKPAASPRNGTSTPSCTATTRPSLTAPAPCLTAQLLPSWGGSRRSRRENLRGATDALRREKRATIPMQTPREICVERMHVKYTDNFGIAHHKTDLVF